MHVCKLCNFHTSTNNNLKIHYNTKKHINLATKYANKYIDVINNELYEKKTSNSNSPKDISQLSEQYDKHEKVEKVEKVDKGDKVENGDKPDNTENYFICQQCNKEFEYKRNLMRHVKSCNNKLHEIEMELIKQDFQHQLEIQELKNKLTKKELEKRLKIKEIEKKSLELYLTNNINHNNIINTTINNVNNVNNIKISKVQFLNVNFGNVIDINTFIDNYKDRYGLTNDQTKTLLESYKNDGVNGCVNSLIYYLKKSAIEQYKEVKGEDVKMEDVILPFLLSDKSLREHFEKSINGNWDKTTMLDNMKKIVSITNDQVFKHHKQHINFNAPQKKRIINGLLKGSSYSLLSQIKNPEFYKLTSNNQLENDHLNIESFENIDLDDGDDDYDIFDGDIDNFNLDENFYNTFFDNFTYTTINNDIIQTETKQ